MSENTLYLDFSEKENEDNILYINDEVDEYSEEFVSATGNLLEM